MKPKAEKRSKTAPAAQAELKKSEVKKRYGDKLWRMRNLYSIKAADTGRVVKFIPRREQMMIYRALLAGVRKIIILKARRLGISTAIEVYAADEVAFNSGLQCSIVDQNQDDASKKLTNIVKVAIESLPAAVLARLRMIRCNDSAVELSTKTGDAASAIYAGKNARGGTNQILHVSEWGVIQADDPARSEEILTGALPSAEHGTTIIETTWKGGRGGHLWNLVKHAMEMRDENRTANDWHLFFFPWWTDASYAEPGRVEAIDEDVLRYLAEKEAELGMKFTDGQKCWYARRKAMVGIFMFREFPTTIDECFRSPIEGAIYANIIDRLRGQGAIRASAVDGSAPVHTFWDLGSPRNTVTWYAQFVGDDIRMIDVDMTTDERALDLTPVERVARIHAKGYNLGYHFLPHDAATTERSGKSFQAQVTEAGLLNTRIVPRTADVWIGINHLRGIMPRMVFRIPACEPGIEALTNYHARAESSGGIAQDIPVHDWSSHAADALRTLAEADMAGMIKAGGLRQRPVGSFYGVSVVRSGLSGGGVRALQGRVMVRR